MCGIFVLSGVSQCVYMCVQVMPRNVHWNVSSIRAESLVDFLYC